MLLARPAAPLLVVFSVGGAAFLVGQSMGESEYNPIMLLGAGMASFAFLFKPTWLLFLIPIGIFIPRVLPRLFGMIGLLEALVPMGLAVVFLRVIMGKQELRITRALFAALVAALPVVLSAAFQRGELDLRNAYLWLGGCATYFLGLNLPKSKAQAKQVLALTVAAGLGLLWIDYWTSASLSSVSMIDGDAYTADVTLYRKGTGSIGGGNTMGAMLSMLAPVLFAHLLLSEVRQRKWWFLAFGLMVTLGVFLLSRSFWYAGFMGVLAELFIVARKKMGKRIIGGVMVMAAAVLMLSVAFPTMTSLTGFRVFESTIDEIKRAIDAPVDYRAGFQQYLDAKASLSRPHLSLIQLRESLESPFWGHGALEEQSRFAHAALPTAMYDYGLFFTIPLLTFCYLWFKGAVHGVSKADAARHKGIDSFDLANLGAAVTTVTGMLFNDFLITTGQYMCLVLFFAGLFGSSALKDERLCSVFR